MSISIFEGTVEHSNLPNTRGLTLDVALFAVPSADTPPPFDGEPPGHAVTDCHKIYKQVDLQAESIEIPALIPFSIQHESGFHYIQIRAILFRFHHGKHFAQHEQFFFTRRPLELTTDLPPVTLPMEWPNIPLEELGVYGTHAPKSKWPWPLSWILR